MNKIYVGNLNYNSTKDQLQEYFSQFGETSDVALPEDKFSGKPRGFAFVTYVNPSDAQKACELANGKEWAGRTLKVNLAQERTTTGGDRSSRGGFGGDRDRDERW